MSNHTSTFRSLMLKGPCFSHPICQSKSDNHPNPDFKGREVHFMLWERNCKIIWKITSTEGGKRSTLLPKHFFCRRDNKFLALYIKEMHVNTQNLSWKQLYLGKDLVISKLRNRFGQHQCINM